MCSSDLINAAKTGMLSSKEIIITVAENIGDYQLVVDPVMIAESGGELLKKDAVSTMKETLFPKATLLTPNIFEAEVLSEIKIKTTEDMKKASKAIAEYGSNVIVKGGHLDATDILYYNDRFHEFKSEKLGHGAHGSGCTFAAAITSNLALGYDLIDAIADAKEFITSSIKNAYRPGQGVRVVNQMGEIPRYKEISNEINELKKTINQILKLENLNDHIPEVGINFAYALKDAKTTEDVAGLSGRIIKTKHQARVVGDVEFGGSKHIANVVLAAMKYDPKMRSCINIRYSHETIKVSKNHLNVANFSREEEPQKTGTMEWGTEDAIKKSDKFPDIIYDKGAKGKEPMIRIIGKNPQDVLGKLNTIIDNL